MATGHSRRARRGSSTSPPTRTLLPRKKPTFVSLLPSSAPLLHRPLQLLLLGTASRRYVAALPAPDSSGRSRDRFIRNTAPTGAALARRGSSWELAFAAPSR